MKITRAQGTRTRILAVMALAALAAAAVAASLAFAHNVVYPNQAVVKKAKTNGNYRGRVNAAKVPCKVNREVQIWHINPNPDVRLGTVFTNGVGRWIFAGPALPAGQKVYALIETKVLPPIPNPPGHNHTCRVDRSPNKVVVP